MPVFAELLLSYYLLWVMSELLSAYYIVLILLHIAKDIRATIQWFFCTQ